MTKRAGQFYCYNKLPLAVNKMLVKLIPDLEEKTSIVETGQC